MALAPGLHVISFDVLEHAEGGFIARARTISRNGGAAGNIVDYHVKAFGAGRSLVARGKSLNDLRENVRACVRGAFPEGEPGRPNFVELNFPISTLQRAEQLDVAPWRALQSRA